MAGSRSETIYSLLTGEDNGRACQDIPEEACREQPGNFLKHILSLSATKTGDGLADPKLVLSWLLLALGAPAALVGFLVPVREAGSLLPQLVTAGWIRSLPRRKWAWSVGSAVQGLAVIGMALAALVVRGTEAGWTIVGLLAIFAVARSVCSVSYKDVLGKTVARSTRGTATGAAGTVAAVFVLLFGGLLSIGILEKSVGVVVAVLLIAGGLWMTAAVIFSTLVEAPGATEGGRNALKVAISQISLLKSDRQLVRFIITRSLLTATAMAPPYLVALSGEYGSRQFGQLGPFVVASGLATVLSSFIWGRLSDRSSRKVLIFAALVGAVALSAAAAIGISAEQILKGTLILPGLHFILMIGYQGVRIGRSTHLVDMAEPEKRAAYTALSNTIIGLVLILGGLFGAVAQMAGESAVLAVFAVMAIAAAFLARTLDEVQAEA
jgi:hypothetical protein